MILISSIPCIIINALQGRGDEWVDKNEQTNFLSIGNHGKSERHYKVDTIIDVIVILNCVSLIVIFIVFMFYNNWITSHSKNLQNKYLTPSLFTVMVYGISKNATPKNLKEWLVEVHGAKGIQDIIYCFDVQVIIKLIRELKKVRNVKSYLEACDVNSRKALQNEETKNPYTDETLNGYIHHPPLKYSICCYK
jgi:hypothetical protein